MKNYNQLLKMVDFKKEYPVKSNRILTEAKAEHEKTLIQVRNLLNSYIENKMVLDWDILENSLPRYVYYKYYDKEGNRQEIMFDSLKYNFNFD